jgi:hypothetical protein
LILFLCIGIAFEHFPQTKNRFAASSAISLKNLRHAVLAQTLLYRATDQARTRSGGNMNKHLIQGLIVGGLFAASITWVAASDVLAEGGFALLASVVFGLAAGICIGGLIAANFAMLTIEEQEATESKKAGAHHQVVAHVNA